MTPFPLSLRTTNPATVAGALCIISYFYNKRPIEIMKDVYGTDKAPNYIREKVEMLVQSPWRWIASLDDLHQGKLIEAAIQAESEWAMGQSNRVLDALRVAATGTPGSPESLT